MIYLFFRASSGPIKVALQTIVLWPLLVTARGSSTSTSLPTKSTKVFISKDCNCPPEQVGTKYFGSSLASSESASNLLLIINYIPQNEQRYEKKQYYGRRKQVFLTTNETTEPCLNSLNRSHCSLCVFDKSTITFTLQLRKLQSLPVPSDTLVNFHAVLCR